MTSVRAKLQNIAEMYDQEGFGGVLLGGDDEDYGGVLLGAAVTKKRNNNSQYSEFVKKYRRGNKYSMSEIAQMWREQKAKGGAMIGGVNVGGVNVGGAKKKSSGSKTAKKPKASLKNNSNIKECLRKLKIAKDNGIKLSVKEKTKLFKNHGCSYLKYKKAKANISNTMSKSDLKKKLLQKPKMK